MAFPQQVAEKALVACGRCCCLCHRFCGTKIELHHVVPRADGGDDTFENCIPLCFNCHADQTSYDHKHPKGRKYTSAELRAHRDKWYQKVQNGVSAAVAEKQTQVEANKDSKDPGTKTQIIALRNGHDLLGALTGAHAFGQEVDQADTPEEAELIAGLLDLVEITELWDEISPGDRYRYGQQASAIYEKLEALDWGICVVRERTTVNAHGREYPNWTTATLRMSKLDPQLVKEFKEGLEAHGITLPSKSPPEKPSS